MEIFISKRKRKTLKKKKKAIRPAAVRQRQEKMQ
jgi:hypothetical protein